jgi:DNA-binding NtrC family response regulator
VEPEAGDYLLGYQWPGNVRELRNVAERLILKARDGRISADLLPAEITRDKRPRESVTVAATPAITPNSQILFDRMFSNGASFWSEVYEPFMARDLTRNDVRDVVRLGLEHTRGNYKMLVQCFNMPPEDYKKFLNFLRKYQCHVPFQRFRMMPAAMGRTSQIATA